MTTKIFKKLLEKVPGYRHRFTRMSMDIASQIYAYMKSQNMNQKQLAIKLNKKESEVSKWLNGNHNFTIETIAKIEDVFNKNIIYVPQYVQEDLGIKYFTSQNLVASIPIQFPILQIDQNNFLLRSFAWPFIEIPSDKPTTTEDYPSNVYNKAGNY